MIDHDVRSILNRARAEARYLPQAVRLVWSATTSWTVVWLILLLVQGLLPAVALYLTKDIVDGLLTAIGSGGGIAHATFLRRAILLGAVIGLQILTHAAAGWVRFLQTEILQDYISRQIHEKSISVRMAFYDFPDFYDHLHRARQEALYRPAALLDVTGALLQTLVTLLGVGTVLLPYGMWLPLALLLSGLPSLVVVLESSMRRREWHKRSTPQLRKTWYYDYLMTAREIAAEVRVFDLGDGLITAYQALRQRLRSEQLDLVRREVSGQLVAALLGLVVGGATAGWVVWQASLGRLTPGAMAMFFAAFVQGQGLMRSLLSNAGQIYMNGLFLGSLFEFLALEPESAAPPSLSTHPAGRLNRGIRFESIDFTYPGSSRKALSNFSLNIPAGRTVAIVGPNGAGKSTILRLLCRFYEPDRGHIWIDGHDIREHAPADVRQLLSVLFQEPVRYAATVRQNVAPESRTTVTAWDVEAAVRAAGADHIVDQLPTGYDTLLTKWYEGGVELSGGEWQRLALARSFLRDAPILLLDEPTSAMDSWAEADWFDRFRHAAAGRTTIIITHRFTTARQADVIHVMDDGRILESGSHDQLIAAKGRYADSWARQTGDESIACAR